MEIKWGKISANFCAMIIKLSMMMAKSKCFNVEWYLPVCFHITIITMNFGKNIKIWLFAQHFSSRFGLNCRLINRAYFQFAHQHSHLYICPMVVFNHFFVVYLASYAQACIAWYIVSLLLLLFDCHWFKLVWFFFLLWNSFVPKY